MRILVATDSRIVRIETSAGRTGEGVGLEGRRPTCLAAESRSGRAWCGTGDGVLRSDDGGERWRPAGLAGRAITALACDPDSGGELWAGTEPSAVWRSADGGDSWQPATALDTLPSSPTWAFPPRPSTHHVRWIALHPEDRARAWVAVEAGALVSTRDGGRSWIDRVPGGPYDTHELAIHPARPETLRVAAGDGWYESRDGGLTWSSPDRGLEVGYLRSVAIDPGDPDVVLVSASTGPRSAYVAGRGDGRIYRREADGPWERVRNGWPDPPATIAPLIRPGIGAGQVVAADERGVHVSDDGGASWRRIAPLDPAPDHLRGLAMLG